MGRRCAITSCYNYGKKPIDTIHSFPTWNPFQRLQWLEYVKMTSKLKVAEVNLDNFGLCCRHFHHEAYNITKSELQSNQICRSGTLKDYAVPSKLTSSENVAIYDYMRVQTDCITFIHAKSNEKPPVQEFNENIHELMGLINTNIEPVSLLQDNFGTKEVCEEGGREYVAGFIAKKLAEDFPQLSKVGSGEQRDQFWVSRVSAALTEPSLYWHAMFKKFDEFFEAAHGINKVNKIMGVRKSMIDAIGLSFPDVHLDIIKYFVGTRTNIRIKHMNQLLEDAAFINEEDLECERLSEEGEQLLGFLQEEFN